MSWRRVAVIYAVLVLLVSYMVVFERGVQSTDAIRPTTAADSLLGTDASSVTAVTFRRAGKLLRATRDDQRWHAVEPPGAQVSPDLLEATDEIRALCTFVVRDLHVVRSLVVAAR